MSKAQVILSKVNNLNENFMDNWAKSNYAKKYPNGGRFALDMFFNHTKQPINKGSILSTLNGIKGVKVEPSIVSTNSVIELVVDMGSTDLEIIKLINSAITKISPTAFDFYELGK